MANYPSAIKRNRQNIKRRAHNRVARAAYRTEIKKTRAAISEGKKDEAQSAFRSTTQLLDKAVIHGQLKKNTAARYKSRLQSQINSL